MAKFCGKCGQRLDAKTGLCPHCDQAALAKKKKGKKSVKAVIAILCCISIIAVGIFCALRFFNSDTVTYTYGEYNSFMEGFTDVLVTDEKSAIEAVDSVSVSLGIGNATEELKVSNVQSVKDDSFYRIQQYYHNIPVYGRSIVVSADKNGKATSLTSNYKQVSADIDLEPKASQDKISKSIKKHLNLDELQGLSIAADNLVIYSLDNEEVLAYRLTINGLGTVIVNADTAEVIQYSQILNDLTAEVKSKDGTVTSIGWQNDDGSYHLYNDEHKIEVFDVKGINTVIDDKGRVHPNFKDYGIDTLYSKNNKFDKDALILLNDVIDISEYYKSLGYGGFEQVHIAINDSYDDGKNARGGGGEFDGVNCAIMLIGKKFDFANKDVVAHEYTHAVTGMLVGWSSSYIENSALNEAYSDIFGTLYENPQNPDWKMVHLSEVIRDLTEPSKTNSYDSMSDINESDNYNQYTLSTIISHSAYLMWNGIDGSIDRKIDATTLSEIWYRSMLLLQSDANFAQCRNAVELSARMMFKNNQITDEQYKTVITAFERVGIENATFTFTETVKNKFDLSVLSSEETENVHYKLEVIKMPTIKAGPNVINNEMPKLVMEKTAITGRQTLDLKDGTYVLRITDVSDERNISQSINIKIVVDGDNSSATDEVIVNTDFTDVIVVVLDDRNSDSSSNSSSDNVTESDIALFQTMLNKTESVWWNSNGMIDSVDSSLVFDVNSSTASFVIDQYISVLAPDFGVYAYLYGNESVSTVKTDPNNQFENGAFVLEADKVDWIIKNMFGVQPNRNVNDSTAFYYKDDKLYIEQFLGRGSGSWIEYTITDYYELENQKYGFAVRADLCVEPNKTELSENYYFVAMLRNDREHGNYWAIEKFSKQKACFDISQKDTTQSNIDVYDLGSLTVSGTLTTKTYEINSNNKGTVYILKLDSPLNINYYANSTSTPTSYSLSEIQCNFKYEAQTNYNIGQKVTVTGKAMEAHTGHHLTDIVLTECTLNTSDDATANSETKEMSADEAKKIAEKYWKFTDGKTDSGITVSISYDENEAITFGGVKYYLFRYRALIDEGDYAHWTTWDQVYINSVTGECSYDPPK